MSKARASSRNPDNYRSPRYWRLWNFLFRWDYAQVKFTTKGPEMDHVLICPVKFGPDKQRIIWFPQYCQKQWNDSYRYSTMVWHRLDKFTWEVLPLTWVGQDSIEAFADKIAAKLESDAP